MHDDYAFQDEIERELERLGLTWASLPGDGLAGREGWEARLLAQLKSLEVGATWHDLLPDLPRHWIAGRPETWTDRYHPQGPWDYQTPPAGPALFAICDLDDPVTGLADLLTKAAMEGWQTYGAGLRDRLERQHVVSIVLPLGMSADDALALGDWIDSQSGWKLGGCNRTGTEDYVE